jgi:hypothetical protein
VTDQSIDKAAPGNQRGFFAVLQTDPDPRDHARLNFL